MISLTSSNPSWEALLQRIRQAGLRDDKQIQKLVETGIKTRNQHVEQQARKMVQLKLAKHHQHPFNSPTPRTGYNQLLLGNSPTGAPVSIPVEDLAKHLLAIGQSGSGKTTLFYNLMSQLPVPFWVFDRKQDYRHLSRDDVIVLPWTRLKFNPLKPPEGVMTRRWAQVFSEIFGHATNLLSGSKNHLLKNIMQLYRLYNLFTEVSPPYPSLHELELLIDEEKLNYVRKTSNYRDTILNRLEAMNLTAGTIFDCSTGYPVEQLLSENVVFEFDGVNRDVQNFLTEILFAYVYEYRLAQNQRDQGLNHVFFLDEAKQVFSVYKERQDAAGIPEIDEVTAKMREFGEGLVVADQEASKLTDSIKANTYTKLLLPTGGRKQFQALTESMNLSELQRDHAKQLEIGEAVLQAGNNTTVPISLRYHPVQKDVDNEILEQEQVENWEQLPTEDRETTIRFEEFIAPGQSGDLEEPEIADDPQEITVSDDAERFLKDVLGQPFKPLTERYSEFSSRYKGNSAKDELVDKTVLIERTVSTASGRMKLLELTEKGRNYVEDSDSLEIDQQGRGGIVHRYWQHRIKDLFEVAGWTPELEVFDADVYIHMDEFELAVEVAMGANQREIEHIDKHLSKDFQAWLICKNQTVREKLSEQLEATDQLTIKTLDHIKEIAAKRETV